MFFFFYKDFKTTAKIYGVLIAAAIIFGIVSKIFGPEDSTPEKGFLKVGISSEFCPYGIVDEKEMAGYLPDVCKYLAIIIEKNLKIRGTTWKEFVPLLKNGTIHVAIVNKKNPIAILDSSINKMAKLDIDKENVLIFSPFHKETKNQIAIALVTTKYHECLEKLSQKWPTSNLEQPAKQ